MVMVTLGLPPGFQVATEDPDAYKTSKVLSAYEITGKQLMLYLSALPASGSQTFKYRLQATMPVTASDGGAEVYAQAAQRRQSRDPASGGDASDADLRAGRRGRKLPATHLQCPRCR